MHIKWSKLTLLFVDTATMQSMQRMITTLSTLLAGTLYNLSINNYRLTYVYALTRGLFWCLFPELHGNEGHKHQNNTRVSEYAVRQKSTYTLLFLTRHNESINNTKMSSPCVARSLYTLLMTSQSIGDDVTITRQLWREHVTSEI